MYIRICACVVLYMCCVMSCFWLSNFVMYVYNIYMSHSVWFPHSSSWAYTLPLPPSPAQHTYIVHTILHICSYILYARVHVKCVCIVENYVRGHHVFSKIRTTASGMDLTIMFLILMHITIPHVHVYWTKRIAIFNLVIFFFAKLHHGQGIYSVAHLQTFT